MIMIERKFPPEKSRINKAPLENRLINTPLINSDDSIKAQVIE